MACTPITIYSIKNRIFRKYDKKNIFNVKYFNISMVFCEFYGIEYTEIYIFINISDD